MTNPRRAAFRLIPAVLGRSLGLRPPAGSAADEPFAAPGHVWEEAVRLAAEQRVAPALGAAAAALGIAVPGEAGRVLAFLRERNAERNRDLRAALLDTARDLNRIGVEPVLLKGAIRLLDGLYPDPSWRFLSDLDLLVPAERAEEAHAHLAGLGYVPVDYAVPAPEDMHHLTPLLHPGVRATVEVHRAVMLEPFGRVLPARALAEGAARLEVEGARLLMPAPERQLVHLVAHAQLHHERHFSARLALRDLLEARLLLRRGGSPGAAAAALRAALAPRGWGRAAETFLALLDRHLPDGAPLARPDLGARLLLLGGDLGLRSARAEAAGAMLGYYRGRLERLGGSAAARTRLRRGLADPAYLARRRGELARLWQGLAGVAGRS